MKLELIINTPRRFNLEEKVKQIVWGIDFYLGHLYPNRAVNFADKEDGDWTWVTSKGNKINVWTNSWDQTFGRYFVSFEGRRHAIGINRSPIGYFIKKLEEFSGVNKQEWEVKSIESKSDAVWYEFGVDQKGFITKPLSDAPKLMGIFNFFHTVVKVYYVKDNKVELRLSQNKDGKRIGGGILVLEDHEWDALEQELMKKPFTAPIL